jgi:predicted amidophosphoribosyltransferase
VTGIAGAGSKFVAAAGDKCARCWMVLEEVKAPTHLCKRCTDAVATHEAAPA